MDHPIESKPKILLVDDEPENLVTLEALLHDLPINILKATSGNEALSLLLESDCAVVFLDVKMPIMDGFETATLILENRRTHHTPLIFVSAHREERSVFKGYGVGGVDYLFKPLDPEIVKSKVRVFVDLYEQRRLLENTNRELAELKTRLELSNEELLKAKEKAEEANRAKSEFLAIMTHEIRNPLATLIGYSEMLATYSQNEESRLNYIHKLHSISQNMTALMNDLLDLSKVEAGKLTMERLRFNPLSTAKEIVSLLLPQAQEKKLGLELVAEGALPETIVSDPTRLKQILTNLIGNAIKFTERGEIGVTARFRRKTDDAPAIFEFLVKDTGCGIETKQHDNLFQPFVQASRSTTRKYGGTGLGLSLSRNFSRALGGDISLVSSGPGCGSTFCIFIEAGEPSEVKTDQGSIASSPRDRRKGPEKKKLFLERGEHP